MNHKKFRRLYREERLQVRRRGGRKRALGTRAPMTVPQGPNQRWSLDFVSDAFACGRRFRIFAVVDDYSRECVRLIADTSISGARVGRELDAAVFERMARPHTIVSDNGTERECHDFRVWAGIMGKKGVPLCLDAKSLLYRMSFSISFWRAALPAPPSSRAVCSIR